MPHDDVPELSDFAGVARLFPLPNLVLFPALVQGLHIFEPRYRQMTADALEGDRLIAMALLRPGWEATYQGKPDLYPVACLGKIVTDQRLPDGRYNLQLRGLSRVRIVREIDDGRLYRSAEVEVLSDVAVASPDAEEALRRRLRKVVLAWYAKQGPALEVWTKLLTSALELGTVADVVTFALPLDAAGKQQLLETLDVELRVRRLLRHLDAMRADQGEATARPFPPEFSPN